VEWKQKDCNNKNEIKICIHVNVKSGGVTESRSQFHLIKSPCLDFNVAVTVGGIGISLSLKFTS
jgi:hypothetical protein